MLHTLKIIERFVFRQEIPLSLETARVAIGVTHILLQRSEMRSLSITVVGFLESLAIFLAKTLADYNAGPTEDCPNIPVNDPSLAPTLSLGFSCLVDLINATGARITKTVADLLSGALSTQPCSGYGQRIASEIALAGRISILRLFNPFPSSDAKKAREASDLPRLYCACPVTNAILELFDIPESNGGDFVRVILRDPTGEFAFDAVPVWEDLEQQEERRIGLTTRLRLKEGWYPGNPVDTVPPTVSAVHDTANASFENQVRYLTTDRSELLKTVLEDAVRRTNPDSAREILQPVSPTAQHDKYGVEKGGRRNHVLRLFLSTVGGMSPAILASDICLLRMDDNIQTALDNLDHEMSYRCIFHAGIHCSGSDAAAFESFFNKLGRPVDESLTNSFVRFWSDSRVTVSYSNRQVTKQAVDDVAIQWCQSLPLDDDVTKASPRMFLHQTACGMFHVRLSPALKALNVGPLLDEMLVSEASLFPCLHATVVNMAAVMRDLTCAPDFAQPNREEVIGRLITHFRSSEPLATVLVS